jgi:hypothetical protein
MNDGWQSELSVLSELFCQAGIDSALKRQGPDNKPGCNVALLKRFSCRGISKNRKGYCPRPQQQELFQQAFNEGMKQDAFGACAMPKIS